MLRDGIAADLRERREHDGYLFPDYGGYCFANVPHTVADLLGAETGPALPADVLQGLDTGPDVVLVVLIDGFGLAGWHREDHALLDRFVERGRVTPLTSVYPSETAAAITTFHTGTLPAEHGVIGWNVYEPRVDTTFEALPFETKDGTPPADMTPGDVADAEPIYPSLPGIDARHVVPFEGTSAGATAHPYDDLDNAGATLADALDAADPPAYVYAYFPQVDAAAHREGTDSVAYREALADVCEQVERALGGAPEETLVIATADHGIVDTDPARNVDLSTIDGVEDSLRRHADGTPIRFAGSPRNAHLHLEPHSAGDVRATLREALDARVFTREAVLERGLFGGNPSETFRRRLADLVVCHRELSVWWGAEPESLSYVGMHGGLSPREMLVPFAAAPATALR